MALLVHCRCGHQFYTSDECAARSRLCPVCGRQSRLVPWGLTLLALALVVSGVGLAAVQAPLYLGMHPGVAAQSWPTTQGIFTGHERAILVRGRAYSDGLLVRYAYTVAGVSYVNGRRGSPVDPQDGFPDSEEGRRQLQEHYPHGTACTVYYNPANPAESCIEPHGPSLATLIVGGAVVVLLMGLGVLLLVPARRRSIASVGNRRAGDK